MKCPTCTREMAQLFLTAACDYCDFGVPQERLHRGYIVNRGADDDGKQEEYVFRGRMDAERWRTAAGRENCEVMEVYSIEPFQWHLSRGWLRDVILADHMYEIFPDHRYEPGPHRAFIGCGKKEGGEL